MCDPVSIGIALAQTAMSIKGQQQQAKTQQKVQERASAAETQRVLAEMSASRLRERQEMTSMAQKMQQAVVRGKEVRSTAKTSAAESGVTGLTVDSLINDLTREQGQYQFSLTQQAGFNAVNRNLGLDDAGMRSYNNQLRINKPINQPNYLGAALDGASTGMSFATGFKKAGLFQGDTVARSTASGLGAGATDLVQPLNFNQAYS